MPSSSKAFIASAGSGKTEDLVTRALAVPVGVGVVLTTFTDNGAKEIRARIVLKNGVIPSNIEVIPWLTFLIRHGVKPYQNPVLGPNQVIGLHFDKRLGFPKKYTAPYYMDKSLRVYRDFLAEFALLLNEESGGAVVKRIAQIYGHLFFDEIQDVSARDFEFLQLLLESPMTVTLCGDPRQGTYSTTSSRTNRGMTKSNVVKWLSQMEQLKLLCLEEHSHSWRCNQAICDFSDALYPEFADTSSLNPTVTGHDGVFLLRKEHVQDYVAKYEPQLLVWDRRSEDHSLPKRNMGEVKGMTFPRVLIQPTAPMAKHLADGSDLAAGARAKFYVAATRARYSVAIVMDKPGGSEIRYWVPS